MLQVLFHLHLFGHDIPIYGYGLMLVAAFLACVQTAQWLARRSGLNPELFANAAIIALMTGVVGARLSHVLENFGEYTRSDLSPLQNLLHVIDIREGGLTYYGGFLLATPCCILYALKTRIPLRLGMDIVAPVLMIGLGLGRIGCFLNGCCYGAQCNLPWGVSFPYGSEAYVDQVARHQTVPPPDLMRMTLSGRIVPLPRGSPEMLNDPRLQARAAAVRALPVQPTELYSTFTALLLAALLIAYFTTPHVDGSVFALMLILEGFARFVLELLRVEPSVWRLQIGNQDYGMSISMILGVVNVIAGFIMWQVIHRPRLATLAALRSHPA
ncbi:MAG: prolipoprotein diacylglyceryl transferase [Planctomycetota bacterium]|nr:prolipoprotein diacylglyceryl transferase [Planctomycetota bacterium]